MLMPPVSHILEFAYMVFFCNSFYLESKLPALSSTLYLTSMVTSALFAKETKPKHCFCFFFLKDKKIDRLK